MKIKIKIPDYVLKIVTECDLGPDDAKKLFKTYVEALVIHNYNQGEYDFDNWFNLLEDEEIADILSE